MGNGDNRLGIELFFYDLLDELICLFVHVGGGLIQDDDLSIAEKGSGQT